MIAQVSRPAHIVLHRGRLARLGKATGGIGVFEFAINARLRFAKHFLSDHPRVLGFVIRVWIQSEEALESFLFCPAKLALSACVQAPNRLAAFQRPFCRRLRRVFFRCD
jgi:hypothetical protein